MLKYIQVDTFSRNPFGGNPAAVFFLQPPRLSGEAMARIAAELRQPVTVFIEDTDPRNEIRVRFHNGCEPIAFSGHGLQAAAHALWTEGKAAFGQALVLQTDEETICISKRVDHLCMVVEPWNTRETLELSALLTAIPQKCYAATRPGLTLLQQESEQALVAWRPDPGTDWSQLGERMLLLTAPSGNASRDFVSRVFVVTSSGLQEVAASGSAHRALLPYWMEKLNRAEVRGEQMANRKGVVHGLRLPDGKLEIAGQAITTLKGIFVVRP